MSVEVLRGGFYTTKCHRFLDGQNDLRIVDSSLVSHQLTFGCDTIGKIAADSKV